MTALIVAAVSVAIAAFGLEMVCLFCLPSLDGPVDTTYDETDR